MIVRRVIALALLATVAEPATTQPLTADRLPPSLLADCDLRAEPYGAFAPAIAEAARALIDIGVFTQAALSDAKIGFCGLQRAGGPVATASCADGVILLDEKYARADQAFVLRATLAHELLHHRQHRERKARFGAGYCESARYGADKPALETEADAFGDAVAALFSLGRGIEIVNACDDPVSVYVEAVDPVAVRGAGAEFQRVPAGSSAIAADRALSGDIRFFAVTTPATGPAHVWRDKAGAATRYVEGRLVRLKSIRLAAQDRVNGPFRLRLACPAR